LIWFIKSHSISLLLIQMDPPHSNSGADRPFFERENSFSENHGSQQHFEENFSGADRRSSASAENDSGSSSSNQPRPPQNNNQDSALKQSGFYKFNMITQVLIQGMEISKIGMFGFALGDSLTSICAVIQAIYGVYGAFEGSLKHIERALMLMKIYVCLRVLRILVTFHFDGFWNQAVPLSLWILFIFYPTIKERNRLKSLSPSHDEERNNDADPIEKLNSWKFQLYKYWLLMASCLIIRFTISSLWTEPEIEEIEVKSEIVVWIVIGFGLFMVFGLLPSFLLAFEGIRKKDLVKIVGAIQLMKLFVVLLFVYQYCDAYGFEKKPTPKFMEDFSRSNPHVDPFVLFLLEVGFNSLMFYLLFMYGAYQVRDILEKHQRHRQRI